MGTPHSSPVQSLAVVSPIVAPRSPGPTKEPSEMTGVSRDLRYKHLWAAAPGIVLNGTGVPGQSLEAGVQQLSLDEEAVGPAHPPTVAASTGGSDVKEPATVEHLPPDVSAATAAATNGVSSAVSGVKRPASSPGGKGGAKGATCPLGCSGRHSHLRRHFLLVHADWYYVPQHACRTCKKAFRSASVLDAHLTSSPGHLGFGSGSEEVWAGLLRGRVEKLAMGILGSEANWRSLMAALEERFGGEVQDIPNQSPEDVQAIQTFADILGRLNIGVGRADVRRHLFSPGCMAYWRVFMWLHILCAEHESSRGHAHGGTQGGRGGHHPGGHQGQAPYAARGRGGSRDKGGRGGTLRLAELSEVGGGVRFRGISGGRTGIGPKLCASFGQPFPSRRPSESYTWLFVKVGSFREHALGHHSRVRNRKPSVSERLA